MALPRPWSRLANPRRGRRWTWIVSTAVALPLVVGVSGVYLTLRHFDVSLRQSVIKAAEWAGWGVGPMDTLKAVLAPAQRFADRPLDGRIRDDHPRILLPGLKGWDGQGLPPLMRDRVALFKAQGIDTRDYDPCSGPGPLGAAVCWVSTGDDQAARRALATLLRFQVEIPEESTEYGNLWELAWAYDLLCLHPAMDADLRRQVEARIETALIGYLALLDGGYASLWHGRSTLAAQAWLAALVLGPGSPERANLVRRAQGHFTDTLRAILITQAWPEGYNYWVNARALVVSLAAAGMVNGLTEAAGSNLALRALERIGLWAVYATRPDGRVEALGDEGPRVDLKDETRRVVDLTAQVTRNPVFSTFSRYIAALHRDQSYYREYRWQLLVLNDPSVPLVAGVPAGQLTGLERALPRAEVFGAGAMNLVIARQGWGPDDTLLTFRAGNSFTHHGQYDAGHFTLFKGAPLAINSATYSGNVFAPHRLYYGVRGIARNGLLVVRPGEDIRPAHSVARSVVDGGPRVVMPTASAVLGVDDWLDNLGSSRHFEGGRIDEIQFHEPEFVYLKSDLTKAYDSPHFDSQGYRGRVRRITRELLYLYDEDRLIVRDDVTAADPQYPKVWLLHTVERPQVAEARALVGTLEAGIVQSPADRAVIRNGRGRLDLTRLMPDGASLRLVGGPGYEYWVPSDTDPRRLTGENFAEGAERSPWFDLGQWRIELQAPPGNLNDRFLVALTPSLGRDRSAEVNRLTLSAGAADALSTDGSVILFPTGPDPIAFAWPGTQHRLLLAGTSAGVAVHVQVDGVDSEPRTDATGVASIPIDAAPGAQIRVGI